MSRVLIYLLLILLGAAAAVAQPAPPIAPTVPDAATIQRSLDALSAQRNRALDADVYDQVQLGAVRDELARAKARIEELEKKLKAMAAPAPDPQPPATP